jgi:hypothetical protein
MKTYKDFIAESKKKIAIEDDKKKSTQVYHPFFATIGKHSITNDVREDYDAYSVSKPNDELHDTLSKHYKLSDHETHNVKKYTAQSYDLNKSLIDKHNDPSDAWHAADHDRMHGAHQSGLDKALANHKTPKDMHVYTGTAINPERFHEKGADHIKLHLPAYTSTSIERPIAESFAKKDDASTGDHEFKNHHHMLRIHVPEGSQGVYAGKHSHYPEEKEFTLPRDTKLHVNPRPTTYHPTSSNRPIAIWHATIHKD